VKHGKSINGKNWKIVYSLKYILRISNRKMVDKTSLFENKKFIAWMNG
jgi:hypothetical protein